MLRTWLFLVGFTAFLLACNTTRPVRSADGNRLPNSVATLKRIKIGGIRQAVCLRGADTKNPVLLYLHGGPGGLSMPMYMHYNAVLEQHFTVAYWDQRGAGKTFSPSTPQESMNLPQFVADTHQMTQWLKKRFKQAKIVLVGHSWGGILGMHVIARHPDDYTAFVSVSPVVNGPENERISYEFAQKAARQKADTAALKILQTIGPPVNGLYESGFDGIVRQRELLQRLGGVTHRDLGRTSKIFGHSKEYSILNYLKAGKASRFSFPLAQQLWPGLNLAEQIPAVGTPVYFCVGKYDYNAVSALTEAYFQRLSAPEKKLIWFDESAHMLPFEEAEKFNQLMISLSKGR